MNSLELINKLILEKKTDIKVHKGILQIDNSKKVFHNVVIRECEEFITALQQIKTILEAWEVIKKYGIYYYKEDDYLELSLIYSNCPENINFQKLIKALEVEDE